MQASPFILSIRLDQAGSFLAEKDSLTHKDTNYGSHITPPLVRYSGQEEIGISLSLLALPHRATFWGRHYTLLVEREKKKLESGL
jgi:hypothetical protein